MTKTEVKKIFKRSNLSEKDSQAFLERFDIEKITEVVERSHTKKSAMKAVNAMYPELDIKEMQKMLDFYESQRKGAAAKPAVKNAAPIELTMEELGYVAGGSGNWLDRNWKKLLVGAILAIGVGILTFATAGAAVGVIAAGIAAVSSGVGVFQGAYNLMPEARSTVNDGTDKWRNDMK